MNNKAVFLGLIFVSAIVAEASWYLRYLKIVNPEPADYTRDLIFPFFFIPLVLLISFFVFGRWETLPRLNQFGIILALLLALLTVSVGPIISLFFYNLVSARAVVGTSNHIAYISKCDSNIYVTDIITGAKSRLTINTYVSDVSWSPDGKSLVFTNANQVNLINIYSRKITALTDKSQGGNFLPDWSPDGKTIVFISTRDNNWEIYTMKPDGRDITRLTHLPGRFTTPAWSPDSQYILFGSYGEDKKYQIYRMNANGSDVIQITTGPFENTSPAWSPDGQRIAFVSDRSGNDEIYTMNADGSNVRQLTNTPFSIYRYSATAWSPDGQQIAFDSNRGGKQQIQIMNVDGSDLRPLIPNFECENTGPAWGPAKP